MNKLAAVLALTSLAGCSSAPKSQPQPAAPAYFQVDPKTAGSIKGLVQFTGRKPLKKLVDMSSDPTCSEPHKERIYDEPILAGPHGELANAFIYIKTGLEGKKFPVPTDPVTIDQKGCWFHPRVFGIQTGQTLNVTNSDPVTHNIHPLAQVNREWNHSQGQGDAPLKRKFTQPEIMIRVKCNIHSWMHAYIGVVEHPYYAVTGPDGSFRLPNLPPGEYTLGIWHETLGTKEQHITIAPGSTAEANFRFEGE